MRNRSCRSNEEEIDAVFRNLERTPPQPTPRGNGDSDARDQSNGASPPIAPVMGWKLDAFLKRHKEIFSRRPLRGGKGLELQAQFFSKPGRPMSYEPGRSHSRVDLNILPDVVSDALLANIRMGTECDAKWH